MVWMIKELDFLLKLYRLTQNSLPPYKELCVLGKPRVWENCVKIKHFYLCPQQMYVHQSQHVDVVSSHQMTKRSWWVSRNWIFVSTSLNLLYRTRHLPLLSYTNLSRFAHQVMRSQILVEHTCKKSIKYRVSYRVSTACFELSVRVR